LKHAVREIFANLFEIASCGSEMAVMYVQEQEFEFRSMDLKPVNLFVLEQITANHLVRFEQFLAEGT
jgi:hypothetical protein